MIEKRLTLERDYPGHHHIKALEPREFKEYVTMIRRAETMLGDYAIRPSPEDLRQKDLYFVSVVAEADIPVGTKITREMLACKRPGTGIAPEFMDLLVGRVARRDIKRNELLTWEVV
jgi:N,N'-diacetyllegionaminate synthase